MTDIHDTKYVVFKRNEFSLWEGSVPDNYRATIPLPIPDAVVIRRKDVFAPPALDAYCNAILTTAEGMQAIIDKEDPVDIPSVLEHVRERVARLKTIADYFHLQAVEAWHTKRSLPD